ncbi:MAG: cadherin-like domain-containing protein, partial [Deltaproteobacteria bacterium]|nr:cadherin-like domain-containing protein [Deltaproteobacteria bacterium]
MKSPSGATGLDSWNASEALDFAPTSLGEGTTAGTFSSAFDIADFAGNVDVTAMHFVSSDLTIGTTNSIDLQRGDLILVVDGKATVGGVDVDDTDVFMFRPDAPSDYSSGSFTLLLDNVEKNALSAVSLVEQDTVVGGVVLQRGSFITSDSSDELWVLSPTVVGEKSDGDWTQLIDGGDIGLDKRQITGVELIEEDTDIGGTTLQAGQLLLSLDGEDASVGDNSIAVTRRDVFYLDVTQAGKDTTADATLLLQGANVGLNTDAEGVNALALEMAFAPELDLDGDDSEGTPGSDLTALFVPGGGPVAIVDVDASLTDVNVPNELVSLTVTLTNAPDGADELLSADTSGTAIGMSYSSGVLTLSGADSAANYQQVLRTLTYDNVAVTPTSTTRTIELVASDGSLDSNLATVTVSINPPSLDLDANDSEGTPGSDFAAAFVVGGGPVGVADVDASVTDVDSTDLSSLTVTISNLLDGGVEVLAADTTGTSITASYADGVLTLSGTDTKAAYAQVLATVTYENRSASPDTTTRTLRFVGVDDLGNRGLPATATVTIEVPSGTLLFSTTGDVKGSGVTGLAAWDMTEGLEFAPTSFEPSSAGSLSSSFDLALFGSNAAISGMHLVSQDIRLGGSGGMDLRSGDLLLSVDGAVSLSSTNDLDVDKDQVFLFRADTPGDYSSGTFTLVLDNPIGKDVSGLTLVEEDTTVGGTPLAAGSLILAEDGNPKLHHFEVTGVGTATSGTQTLLVDGKDIGVDGKNASFTGVELVESATTLGGTSLDAGQLLVTLDSADGKVGDTPISVEEHDVFILDVGVAGDKTEAEATLLLEGLDVNLDANEENLNSLAIRRTLGLSTAGDKYQTGAGAALVVGVPQGVLANDYDPEGGSLTAMLEDDAANGSVALAGDGSFTYTPGLGFEGTDTFTYRVTNGSFESEAVTVTIEVGGGDVASGLLFSTTGDVTGSGVTGLANWDKTEGLAFAPTSFEPASAGSLSSSFDLSLFGSGAAISGMHLVSQDITVGTASTVDLQAGDLLLAVDGTTSLSSTTDLDVDADQVFLFRPDSPGDYSSGTFTLVLDDPIGSDVSSLTLVEEDTTVGGMPLSAGSLILGEDGNPKLHHFAVTGVGATTSGIQTLLVDGKDIDINNKGATITGVDLIEQDTDLAGTSLTSGQLLLTLDSADGKVGDTPISIEEHDVFVLDVGVAGDKTEAEATLLLEGLDVNLDANNENLNSLAMRYDFKPVLDLDANDSSGATTDNYATTFTEDGGPVAIAHVDATLTDADSPALASLTVTLTNPLDGAAEVLAADTSGTSIVASYVGNTLTLTGPETADAFQQVLRTVTYDNSTENPTETDRLITFVANDGVLDSNMGVATVEVVSVNDAPILATNAGTTVDEAASVTLTAAMLAVTDADNGASEIEFTLTALPASGTLELSTVPLGLSDTFTQDDIAAGRVVYVHDGSETTSDSLTFTVSDGAGGAIPATVFSITVNPTNDAPVLGDGTLTSVVQNTANPPGDTVASIFLSQFSDADAGSSFSGAAVVGNTANPVTEGAWEYTTDGTNWHAVGTVTDGATALAIDTATELRFVPVIGFTGNPTALEVRALDDSYAGSFSTAGVTETRVTVDTSIPGDPSAIAAATSDVATTITSDFSPAIAGALAGQATTDTVPVNPFAAVVITDTDVPAQVLTVVVTLDDAAKGQLSNLGGFLESPAGTYTFSGTAAAATTAIQGLLFDPTDNRVSTGLTETTQFTITADDTIQPVVTNNTTTVISTSVSDPPTIVGAATGQVVTDKTTVDPFSGVTVDDPDGDTLSVTIVLDDAAKGDLVNLGGFVEGPVGTYAFNGSGAAATAALNAMTFDPAENRVTPGLTETTSFTLTVDDGTTPVVDGNTSVISTSVNDPSTISGTVGGQVVTDQTTVDPFS